ASSRRAGCRQDDAAQRRAPPRRRLRPAQRLRARGGVEPSVLGARRSAATDPGPARHAPGGPGAGARGRARPRASRNRRAVRDLLRDPDSAFLAAADRPLLVLADDAHMLDTPPRDAILFAARRAATLPLPFLLPV